MHIFNGFVKNGSEYLSDMEKVKNWTKTPRRRFTIIFCQNFRHPAVKRRNRIQVVEPAQLHRSKSWTHPSPSKKSVRNWTNIWSDLFTASIVDNSGKNIKITFNSTLATIQISSYSLTVSWTTRSRTWFSGLLSSCHEHHRELTISHQIDGSHCQTLPTSSIFNSVDGKMETYCGFGDRVCQVFL